MESNELFLYRKGGDGMGWERVDKRVEYLFPRERRGGGREMNCT